MFRSLIVLTTFVCAIQCTSADARNGRWFRGGAVKKAIAGIGSTRNHPSASHSHYGNPGSGRSYEAFGLPIGIGSYGHYPVGSFNPNGFHGYVHDPYRYGSFDAPDLLNDPYFRERHRYDSRYPGRRRSR